MQPDRLRGPLLRVVEALVVRRNDVDGKAGLVLAAAGRHRPAGRLLPGLVLRHALADAGFDVLVKQLPLAVRGAVGRGDRERKPLGPPGGQHLPERLIGDRSNGIGPVVQLRQLRRIILRQRMRAAHEQQERIIL